MSSLPAPAWIAHADWGSAPRKRVVVTAEARGGAYRIGGARPVAPDGPLTERLAVRLRSSQTALLGFDFPIGVPRRYAELAGIEQFTSWLRDLSLDAPLFDVAGTLDAVSVARPFFPRSIRAPSPGIKQAFHDRLGLSRDEALRRCDRAHAARRAASELFWTLGPQAVGKTALAGWRDAVRPALTDPAADYAVWPFDGRLDALLVRPGAVIVEAYPAEAYGRLGLQMGRPGSAKTRQESRRRDAAGLRRWCAESEITIDDALAAQIDDGFGPDASGEDAFDATVGLCAMIDALRRPPDPLLPDDPAVRHQEGWIFGQHVVGDAPATTPGGSTAAEAEGPRLCN